MRVTICALVSAAALFPFPAATSSALRESTLSARAKISAASGDALRGDIAQALQILRSIPERDLNKADGELRACILNRFDADADGSFPAELPLLTARSLGAYQYYWRAGLSRPADREEEEGRLKRNLARILSLPADTPMDEIEVKLGERLKSEGFNSLMGRTPPFRELMLWRREAAEMREVALPEGSYRVNVKILDDFASFGWSGFATCGRSHTGGWVRPDAIYAVRPGWRDLNGENFLVSFLAHEAQHFADRERFQNLESWELEYRAKLVELMLADTTLTRLLVAFSNSQSDDPAIPHAYANNRVLAALRKRLNLDAEAALDNVPREALRQAVDAELRADTGRRRENMAHATRR